MTRRAFTLFSGFTVLLNRGLAWIDFGIHYSSSYFLYLFLRGLKPQTHTRPGLRSSNAIYTPSVLVTGASEGIGLATAIHLASKGYNVFATVKEHSEIQKVRDAVDATPAHKRHTHGAIHASVMDVLSQDSINKCAAHVDSMLADQPNKPLVGVVNNAGYCLISPMELTPDEEVRKIFELDYWGYQRVIRAFLPQIKRSKGRFINVGSYAGFVNPPMWVPYASLKAAIEGMTRAWRFELMPFGVGMTTIRPGWARTGSVGPHLHEGWDKYYDQQEQDKDVIGISTFGETIKSEKPVGKTEEEIYRPMMDKWYRLTTAAADGIAQPAEAVATAVHDAMTDRFLQSYYTVGYDALLGQMVRDLTPENIYEFFVAKTFKLF